MGDLSPALNFLVCMDLLLKEILVQFWYKFDSILPVNSQAGVAPRQLRGWQRPRTVPNWSFDVVTLFWRQREFNSVAMVRQFQVAYEPENCHI